MYLVKDYLADSYVIDADNYLVHNFLLDNPTQSLYFGVQKSQFIDEWVLEIVPVTQRVNEIVIRSGSGRILSGISYWSQTDGQKLKHLMEQYYQQADFADLYWDNVVKENLAQLQVGLFPIEEQDTFEIDSIADLDYLRQQVEKNKRVMSITRLNKASYFYAKIKLTLSRIHSFRLYGIIISNVIGEMGFIQ